MLEKMLPAVTYMLALFFFLPKLPLFCLLVDMLVSSKEVILSTWILKYLKVWSMHRSNYERVTLIVMTWDGKCSNMFNNKACHLPCYNFLHWRKEGTMKSDNGELVFFNSSQHYFLQKQKKKFSYYCCLWLSYFAFFHVPCVWQQICATPGGFLWCKKFSKMVPQGNVRGCSTSLRRLLFFLSIRQ